MPTRTIKVFEHEKLTLSKDVQERYLTQVEFDALVKFNDENEQQYFKPIYRGIRFNQFVGVIQVGNLTLEILPKADKNTAYDNRVVEQWRDALLCMLKICNKLTPDAVSEAQLQRRQNSLLDLYFKMYLDEVRVLLHMGLFKKYRSNSGNIKAWKGRMNFSKDIQKNLIHKERFFTDHQIYSYDHNINRILAKAMEVIASLSQNPDVIDECKKLTSIFPELSKEVVTIRSFQKIKESRKIRPYKKALKIAEIIILNFSSEIKTGGTRLFALLFDMNKLWEEYLYRMLSRCDRESTKVSAQQSMKFWSHKTIRPDIVLNVSGVTYIIDAKWKIIDRTNPADGDLKQMYAYNMYWDAAKSMLLYPMSQSALGEETFESFHKGREGENMCKLGFINIFNEYGQLDKLIGNRIIEKLVA